MIADLKPYADYKGTGLPWLDCIPKHWDMVPNRALMQEQRQVVGGKATEYTLLSLTLRGVIPRDMDNPKGKFPAEFNTYKVVRPEDLVFCLFDIDETPRGVGHAKLNGMITGAYDVFSPQRNVNPRFLYLYYLFVDDGKLLKPLYTGLRKTIQRGVFASLKTPLPPAAEQTAIVRFLNLATARLERAIRAKRKVIGLLSEQKHAIIHRAVTRGLDSSVPLKPSGVSWLGDIPQHWEVRKLSSLFHTQGSGTTPSGDAYYGGAINWVMSGDLNDSVITRTKRTVHEQALTAYSTLKLYPPNSVAVAMYGATIGKTGILGKAACTNQACCVFADAKSDVNVSLIQLVLQTAKPHLLREAYGGGQPNINAGVVRSLRVPFPPYNEQVMIVGHVQNATSKLTVAISRLEREIELLREYRARLVADVVTGKLDVREAAARLPEEAAPDITEVDADSNDEPEAAGEEAAL